MKMIVAVALALVAVIAAAPAGNEEPEAANVQLYQEPNGSYNLQFATKDGTQRQEEGLLKEVLNEDNKPQNVVIVKGSYSFVDENGQTVEIQYEADENGFRASGPSIPTNN